MPKAVAKQEVVIDDPNTPVGEELTEEEKGLLEQDEENTEPVEEEEEVAEEEAEEETSEEEKGKQRTVNYGAFHRERQRRQEAETGRKSSEERAARAEQRVGLILERLAKMPAGGQQQVAEEDAIPDVNEDPVGHIVGILKKQAKMIDQLSAGSQQQTQEQHTTNLVRNLQSSATEMEQEFMEEHDDYNDASAFLQSSRHEELKELGFNLNERRATIAQEALAIAARSMQQGRNPAEVVYNMAKKRGFARKAPTTTVDEGKKKILAVRKGQEQESPLRGRGNSPKSVPTAQALIDMSEADFDKFLQDPKNLEYLGA